MSNASITAPVIAGLAVGVAFLVIFALVMNHVTEFTIVRSFHGTTIIIPEGASLSSSGKSFEPEVVNVVIGLNNTVRWVNNDVTSHWIEADNDEDPDFFMATTFGASSVGERQSYLVPGASFEYTFTKPGEFGYHGQPWMRGTIVVLSQEK